MAAKESNDLHAKGFLMELKDMLTMFNKTTSSLIQKLENVMSEGGKENNSTTSQTQSGYSKVYEKLSQSAIAPKTVAKAKSVENNQNKATTNTPTKIPVKPSPKKESNQDKSKNEVKPSPKKEVKPVEK